MNDWTLHHGDCIPHMAEEMEPESVDMSIFSPPFPSLYAYTSEDCDIGNTDTVNEEATIHLSFFFNALRRVMKPGRVVIVHVCQIPRMKRCGGVGLFDFRGLNIRLGERAGLIYEFDWMVPKNPQAQAIRTRSRELQFAGLESDRASTRGSIADYLIKFRAPGENAVPINSRGQVSRNQWIDWAESAWYGIRETDTLNTEAAKGENDTRHICPLQLPVIDRCVRLFSNPGELVFSPFAGIGSEGYVALTLGRRFYGCEIKDEYFTEAQRNLSRAEVKKTAPTSVRGTTPIEERSRLIHEFKSGARRVLISKPKVLGFGLNLQVATRQVFNGLNDSYEEYYQAVKRSNRIGSTRPLNVHIPITEIEEPMLSNVLAKAQRVESDTLEQQRLFMGHVECTSP